MRLLCSWNARTATPAAAAANGDAAVASVERRYTWLWDVRGVKFCDVCDVMF